jgi:hypothetical protein
VTEYPLTPSEAGPKPSLTRAEAPPPPGRPVTEITAERDLLTRLIEAMETRVLPDAERCRDQLREQFGQVEAKRAALGQRITAAAAAEQERQRAEGQAVQAAWITPSGASRAFPMSELDKLLVEAERFAEVEWTPANQSWQQQERHVDQLGRRLSLERMRLADLEAELAAARRAQAAPAPDPVAAGRLRDLARAVAALGAGR